MTTDTTNLRHIALAAWDAGMSIIPIRNDGHKKPAVAWKQYQNVRAPKEQVRAWFAPGHHQAAAVVCGEVSGWLVMIEMEGWAFEAGHWATFREHAVSVLGEDRWAEITRYVEKSPSGGVHIYVRCPGYEIGNVKLAMRDGVVAMETRGQGGYSIIAGSVGHPSGNGWEVATPGVLADIVTVSHDELDVILAAARTLHEEPAVPSEDPRSSGDGEQGGMVRDTPATPAPSSDRWMDETIEDFNRTTSVLTWLSGFEYLETDTWEGETVQRLHRIGSPDPTGHGALIFESGRVGFFSTNCPSWAEPYSGVGRMVTYDPFTVMMWEEKGTNDVPARVAIALELRAQGFGPPLDTPERHSDETTVDPDTGETEPETGMSLRWVDEAIANPPTEPEILVTSLLRRGEVTVLGAPRAIGKTWASLNLANICARGEGMLFGSALYKATTPARVLYLQGELGEWGSASRWAALPHETPEGMVAETFDRIRIRTTQRSVTTVDSGTTYHDTHMDAVVDWRLEPAIETHGIDVLIIDPWATFFAGNENNNDETEAAITALIDIARRQDIAVFIVHHISNKTDRGSNAEPEDLWRGASRLADAVSTRMTVLPYYTDKTAGDAGLTRMEARKHVKVTTLERNGPSPEMIYAKRDAYWWESWQPPEVGRPEELTVRDLTRLLRDQPAMAVPSKRRLCALLEKSHGAVDRVVELALAQGLVEETPGARGAVGYRLVGDIR